MLTGCTTKSITPSPPLHPYASTVKSPAEESSHEALQNRVGNIEQKLDRMVILLDKLLQQMASKQTALQDVGRGNLGPAHVASQVQ